MTASAHSGGLGITPKVRLDIQTLCFAQPDNPRRLVPYSCRHTYASLADRAEVDKDALIKMIGHASYKFTKRTYIHENLPQFAAEIKKLEQLVQNELITERNRKTNY